MTTLVATIAFSGDVFEVDPDGAAKELRAAGFTVFRLPAEYTVKLGHPLDDFIEVMVEVKESDDVIGDVMAQVDAIVDRYGGLCPSCGAVPPGYEPFNEMFGPRGWRLQ